MAYDRYDTRQDPRDEGSRWRDERGEGRWRGDRGERSRGGQEERGWFERAGDEISSWFGDDEDDRRRGEPRSGRGRDDDRGFFRGERQGGSGGSRERGEPWGSGERDRDRERNRDFDRSEDRGYRPVTGDYSRSEQFSGSSRGGFGQGDDDRSFYERSQSPWGRDEYRRSGYTGSSSHSPDKSRDRHDFDPHYHSWRERQISELDRDYDEYRREHQSRFEDDFAGWRERRQQKRGLLSQIREHMEVVGNDDTRIGKVDRVAGDRIILTKSDPESGGAHHSLSCSDIDRVEGDRVILDCSAKEAKQRWRDDDHSRALFEREDQGESGPHMLNRSFEGTYR